MPGKEAANVTVAVVTQVTSLAQFERERREATLGYLEVRRRLAFEEIDAIDLLTRDLRGRGPVSGAAGGGNGHEPDAEKRRALAGDRETGEAALRALAGTAPPEPPKPRGRKAPGDGGGKATTLSPNDVLEVLKVAGRPLPVGELQHALVRQGLAPRGVGPRALRVRLHRCLSTHRNTLWRNLGRATGWEALPDA